MPSSLPLTAPIRERGSSVTPAFEGWYFDKDGAQRVLVGYFNRNTKQEFDIPVGPNNRIEPGGPIRDSRRISLPGRQWGVFSIKLPKDFGTKKLTWTIVANGFTNTITLHTQADYIVEPFEDAANKNTPPVLKFQPDGQTFTGAPNAIAEKYTATVGTPLALTRVGDRRRPEDQHARSRGRTRARPRRAGRAASRRGGRGACRAEDSRRRRRSRSPGRSSAARAT